MSFRLGLLVCSEFSEFTAQSSHLFEQLVDFMLSGDAILAENLAVFWDDSEARLSGHPVSLYLGLRCWVNYRAVSAVEKMADAMDFR